MKDVTKDLIVSIAGKVDSAFHPSEVDEMSNSIINAV